MNLRQIVTIARWLLSAVLFFIAYRRITGGETVDMADYQAVSGILSGAVFLIGGVVFIAPELIEWGSMPLRALFNSIFFPGTQETPPPDYNLPLLYREQGRYDEALEGYMKLLKNHPQELLGYIEGIHASFESQNEEFARKFLNMGLRDLATEEAREHVQRVFDTCLAAPPPLVEEEEPTALEESYPPRSES